MILQQMRADLRNPRHRNGSLLRQNPRTLGLDKTEILGSDAMKPHKKTRGLA